MNCKQGDCAIVTGAAEPGFVGAICEVLQPGAHYEHIPTGQLWPGWIVEFPRAMPWGQGSCGMPKTRGWYPDKWLLPLRPSDGEDEILRIAGKPVPARDATLTPHPQVENAR